MIKIIDIDNLYFSSENRKSKFNSKTKKYYQAKEYKQFIDILILECLKTRKLFNPPYKILIEFHAAIDIDNPIKAILDALQKGGIITNDNYVYDLHIKKIPAKKGKPGNLKIYIGDL